MSVPFHEQLPEPRDDSGDPADPDWLLERIRDLVHSHIEVPLDGDQAAELVLHVDLLDDWLAAGYRLPRAWRDAGTFKVPVKGPRRDVADTPPL